MTVIFDSNVWIALFNENDSHHRQAHALFFSNTVIHVPEYVILETTTVLQLRASKQKADLFAGMVGNTSGLEILMASDDLFHAALNAFQQQTRKLSFVDCALWVLSKHYAIHTFDQALMQALND